MAEASAGGSGSKEDSPGHFYKDHMAAVNELAGDAGYFGQGSDITCQEHLRDYPDKDPEGAMEMISDHLKAPAGKHAKNDKEVLSKAWEWSRVKEPFWDDPSEDSYYYLNRWKTKGFKRMLDLGCGKGRHSVMFARAGFNVSALDLSESGIAFLREKCTEEVPGIDAVVADMKELPYESSQFDCIFAYHSVYHTDSKGIKKVFSEMRRVLKTGGELFVTLNSKNSDTFKDPINERTDPCSVIKKSGIEEGVPHFYADREDIKELLYGFRTISQRHIEDIYEGSSSWHHFINAVKD